MARKIRLGVLFGGRSCEHEVSVTSARSMLAAIDTGKYEVVLIGISKRGHWQLAEQAQRVLAQGVVEGDNLVPVLLDHSAGGSLVSRRHPDFHPRNLDVVFPLLHGPYGEDGTVQGLLELAGIPYVGSGVTGSAVGMDKAMAKRAFRAEGLPILEYRVIDTMAWEANRSELAAELERALGYPMFVKPAALGSSVGVHRITDNAELLAGARDASRYDENIVFEKAALDCREIECAVLGNEAPAASVPGEIITTGGFYDYDAKYVHDTSRLVIPAELDPRTAEKIQALSIAAFRAIEGAGLARVDFFVGRGDDRLYVNEINTMPGFTPISMYPKLWEASGVPYRKLIDRLIELALARHERRGRRRTVL